MKNKIFKNFSSQPNSPWEPLALKLLHSHNYIISTFTKFYSLLFPLAFSFTAKFFILTKACNSYINFSIYMVRSFLDGLRHRFKLNYSIPSPQSRHDL